MDIADDRISRRTPKMRRVSALTDMHVQMAFQQSGQLAGFVQNP